MYKREINVVTKKQKINISEIRRLRRAKGLSMYYLVSRHPREYPGSVSISPSASLPIKETSENEDDGASTTGPDMCDQGRPL